MAVKPIILVILDGFGLSPITEGNAIMAAETPFLDWAIARAPKALLHASGSEVGLDWGEMGNSEVGHLNIGTGRIVMQDLPRIDRAIEDGSFFSNAVMQEVAETVKKHHSTLHLIGLASQGGVHAHLNHMLALLDFAKKEKIDRVALHLITDGRDTQPTTFIHDLPKIEAKIAQTGVGVIATIAGRYYAMDRDKRWERIQQAFLAIALGKGRTALSGQDALATATTAKETDEFITPTVITGENGKPLATLGKNDVVIFTNYRSDRARQLASSLVQEEFADFPRAGDRPKLFVSFTSYGQEASSSVKVAFFAPPLVHQLAELIAAAKLPQLHIAETEKYAHVTYFFNGGREESFAGEQRVLVPSPKVATYDEKPEMNAAGVAKEFLKAAKKGLPPFSVLNFANPDMVGHTGDLKQTIRAIETVDAELVTLTKAVQAVDGIMIVTADHGNAEQLIHPETHEIDKEHTTNPVPYFLISKDQPFETVTASADNVEHIQFAATPAVGVLADIAPTILDYLELEKPAEMTGQSLKGLV